MSDENQLDSSSFNKNYKVLKETADWLSTQKEPDIDQLVPKVEKAMKAYQICKDRLTKVQETLGIRSAEPYPRGRAAPWAEEHTCDDPAPNGGVRRASARRAAFRTVPRCGGRCLWSCADASAAHLSIGELSAASPKTTTAAGAGRTEPDQVRYFVPINNSQATRRL